MSDNNYFDSKVETNNNKYYDTEKQTVVSYNRKSADNKVIQDLALRYGKALDQFGMNVENPIIANAIYYNKSGFNLADPPQASRTFVFITRPDCNFARANLRSIPFLDGLYELPIGKMIFPMLTHPHRYINHTYAQDDFPKHKTIFEKFWEFGKQAQNAENAPNKDVSGDITNLNDFDLYKSSELQQIMADYKSQWTDPEQSDGSIETLNYWGVDKKYDFRMNRPPKISNLNSDAVQRANLMPIRYSKEESMNKKRGGSYDVVDYTTPFIPLLMNHCLEVSSGKDFIIASKETEGDYYGGRQSYPTGAGEMNASGEINLTFRDNYYSMIFNLFWTWVTYIDGVSRGELMPRIDNIWEKVLDFTCSIYVFVCDKDFSTIKGFAKYTGCRPTSVSTSGIIHSAKGDINSNWEQIQVPFVYNHVEYMNPEIFTDFNYVAGTEYDRKLRKDFKGYSLLNSDQSRYSADDMFEKVGEGSIALGISGQGPNRALKVDSRGEITSASMSKDEENDNLNQMMPPLQRISMNDTWGGYPMVNGNRLIWTYKNRHKVASSIYGSIDNSYDEQLEEELSNKIKNHKLDSDPEGREGLEELKYDG